VLTANNNTVVVTVFCRGRIGGMNWGGSWGWPREPPLL
jgi:hypothetical protein